MVDVETTGLQPRSNRVLQIAVSTVAADGRLEGSWSTLLDPGCDPGPTHIHGITREHLHGAPSYDDVAHHVRGLLAGRVLVAHNAIFDWRFLSAEAVRSTVPLQVAHRLCTLALTRRLDLPLPDMKLGSVAAYWGVPQQRAHDAADDTRVLVEVLRHSLVVADRLEMALPLAMCSTADVSPPFPAPAPRPACPWAHPGRWVPHTPLVQGMKVVVTGETTVAREVLVGAATRVGLDVMNSVSSRTSVLVCDDLTVHTRKLEAAQHHGIPVITSTALVTGLASVAPGRPKSDRVDAMALTNSGADLAPATRRATDRGRLTGRRVLILGGPHPVAAEVRERVASAGGQAAANLTASVTDVITLEGAQRDRRWAASVASELQVLDPVTLMSMEGPSPATPLLHEAGALLPRGGVVDLPAAQEWSLSVRWPDLGAAAVPIDVVAVLVDADEQVGLDEDLLFYNALTHPSGAADLVLDVPGEAVVSIRTGQLPHRTARVLVAAVVGDGATFGRVGPVELVLRDEDGRTAARATLDAATDEQSLYLAAVYHRAGRWRFRAIGQGHAHGLGPLLVRHGVDVEDD